MKAARSVDFFTEQNRKAEADLEKYFHDPDMEILHVFRVEVKKMRAVLFQLEQLAWSKKVKKAHRRLRHIFHKAGHIRELQLEQSWLKRHRKFDLLRLMEYDKNLIKADRSFHTEVPEMLHIFKKIRGKLEQSLMQITQHESDIYVTKKWQETLHAILVVTTASDWHETRKKIKQLLYALNWIPEVIVLSAPVNRIFQALDNLQSLIGQWHDMILLQKKLLLLKKKIKGHAIQIREQQLAIRKLQAEKGALEKDIRSVFRQVRKYIMAYR